MFFMPVSCLARRSRPSFHSSKKPRYSESVCVTLHPATTWRTNEPHLFTFFSPRRTPVFLSILPNTPKHGGRDSSPRTITIIQSVWLLQGTRIGPRDLPTKLRTWWVWVEWGKKNKKEELIRQGALCCSPCRRSGARTSYPHFFCPHHMGSYAFSQDDKIITEVCFLKLIKP